jgi:hypothetical protein
MFNRLSGATRLFPIGDPIKYVESPMHLTSTFGARDYNGICVPMQVPADDLDAVMVGLVAARNVDGILVTMPHKFTAFALCATSSERTKMLGVVSVIRRNPEDRPRSRSTPGSVRAPASDGWCATRCSGVGIRRCAGCWVAVLMRCSRRANNLRHQLTRPLSACRTCQLLSASRAMSRSC